MFFSEMVGRILNPVKLDKDKVIDTFVERTIHRMELASLFLSIG